jgi:hypothetical protein
VRTPLEMEENDIACGKDIMIAGVQKTRAFF